MSHRTPLKTCYYLPMTPRLIRLQNTIFKEVLAFARHRSGKPDMEDLSDYPDLAQLCDPFLLVKAGVLRTTYTDSLPDGSEGVVIRWNSKT